MELQCYPWWNMTVENYRQCLVDGQCNFYICKTLYDFIRLYIPSVFALCLRITKKPVIDTCPQEKICTTDLYFCTHTRKTSAETIYINFPNSQKSQISKEQLTVYLVSLWLIILSQSAFTFSKFTIETLEQGVKYVQS